LPIRIIVGQLVMLGTKLEAFSNTDDEDRNNYIKQMLRRKRSEMVNDAKQPRSCSDNNGTTASTPLLLCSEHRVAWP